MSPDCSATPFNGRTSHHKSILFLLVQLFLCSLLLSSVPLQALAQPENTSTPLSFIMIGDAGNPEEELTENAEQMLRTYNTMASSGLPASLLFFLGDNFYPVGLNIPEDDRRELIEDVIGPHRELMGKLGSENVHAIAGNHDYYCTHISSIPFGHCLAGNYYEERITEWTYHFGAPVNLRYPIREGSNDSVDFILIDSPVYLMESQDAWLPYLDSLKAILRVSGNAPSVRWRFIITHHSPYSVGAHAGYRLWLSDEQRIGYIGNCVDEGDDPKKYVERFFGHEDNCTDQYRTFRDTMMAVIEQSGVPVQAWFAGHEHSLQLLNNEQRDCDNCPKIFVISGAGSKREPVRVAMPPYIYTHPLNNPIDKGESIHGFVTGTLDETEMTLRFISGETGEPLDMGNAREFVINQDGELVETR